MYILWLCMAGFHNEQRTDARARHDDNTRANAVAHAIRDYAILRYAAVYALFFFQLVAFQDRIDGDVAKTNFRHIPFPFVTQCTVSHSWQGIQSRCKRREELRQQ